MAEWNPINYNIDVKSPFESVLQGYQAGVVIRNDQLQQQQLQQQREAQLQMQKDLFELSKNPNTRSIIQAGIKYPQLSEQLKRSYDEQSSEEQQASLSVASQAVSAIASGDTDLAKSILQKQADAAKNSGDQRKYDGAQALLQQLELHPESALTTGAMYLAQAMGAKEFNAAFGGILDQYRKNKEFPAQLRKDSAEASKAESEAIIKGVEAKNANIKTILENKKLAGDIDEKAGRLALDRDKLTTDTQLKLDELKQKNGEIPEFVAKDINTAVTDSIAAKQSSTKMLDLAASLEKEGGGYGPASSFGEWVKKTTGNQNEATRLRSEYKRIVTPAAMAAYKKVASGSTSDKDIETALTGVPPESADAAYMASYLRGLAKLQTYDSIANNAKAEWLGANKNLGKSRSDQEIDGVRVPAGTTFKEFNDKYLEAKAAKQFADDTVKGRSYMRFANPGAQ